MKQFSHRFYYQFNVFIELCAIFLFLLRSGFSDWNQFHVCYSCCIWNITSKSAFNSVIDRVCVFLEYCKISFLIFTCLLVYLLSLDSLSVEQFLFMYVLLRYDHFAVSARFVLPRLYVLCTKNCLLFYVISIFRFALSLLLLCATVRYQL